MTTYPRRKLGAKTFSTYVSNTVAVVLPTTARQVPYPRLACSLGGWCWASRLRDTERGSSLLWGPGVECRKRGVCTHFFIYEHQPPGVKLSDNRRPLSRSQEPVPLSRPHSPCFRLKSKRLSARQRVESLRILPMIRCRKQRLCSIVAAERSFTFSSRSFSTFGLPLRDAQILSWG